MRKTTLATQLSSLSGFPCIQIVVNFEIFKLVKRELFSGLQKVDHVINWCKRPIASQTLHTKDSNCAR